MSEVLAALQNSDSLTQAQWMVISIVFFIVLGVGYFILRLYKIIKGAKKSQYKPNIGLSRAGYKLPPSSKSE